MIIEWSSGGSAKVTNYTRDFSLNQKPVLLLHCNGTDQATSFPDNGGTGHTVTANGTAKVVTAQSKWGGSCCLLDGDSDYLTVPDHADFDVSTNWTLDLWAKHADHVGEEWYVAQIEAADAFWRLMHVHGVGFSFRSQLLSNDTTVVEIGGEITDTNWHHVAICRIGDEWGIYKDGTQVCYTSDPNTNTFAGSLYIGATHVPGNYFDGHLEEIHIAKFNVFNAAPVAGKTDIIMVPSRPYMSWG